MIWSQYRYDRVILTRFIIFTCMESTSTTQQHQEINSEAKVQTQASTTHHSEQEHPSLSENVTTIDPLSAKRSYFALNDLRGQLLCNMQHYFSNQFRRKLSGGHYSEYLGIPSQKDEDRLKFTQIFKEMSATQTFSPSLLNLTQRQSRGIAAVLGMAICDALGASTEFQHFTKKGLGIIKQGFEDIKYGRHGFIGVWTDDASMGLCMADSVLLNDFSFNPTHIRYLFQLWLQHGLNNGGRPHSIGLGGNISISMSEFKREQRPYTDKGDRFNSGNGSLMRLAPIPVAFADNPQKGVEYCGLSSETTHNGYQAAQCCKLMGKIIIELINRPQNTDGRQVLLKVCNGFQTKCKSVHNLARSQSDSDQLYNSLCAQNKKFKMFNKTVDDRNWNWMDAGYTYAGTRLKQQPGYIGSYCMDALAMALHTVWHTKSFREVALMNADMGGDCDTVGSIAGQIAGAMYGVDEGMLRLYSQMHDFRKERYQVFIKGYKLIGRRMLK